MGVYSPSCTISSAAHMRKGRPRSTPDSLALALTSRQPHLNNVAPTDKSKQEQQLLNLIQHDLSSTFEYTGYQCETLIHYLGLDTLRLFSAKFRKAESRCRLMIVSLHSHFEWACSKRQRLQRSPLGMTVQAHYRESASR